MKKCGKKKFKEMFKRGLGKALVVLHGSDNKDLYKDIVLWCCLHGTAYDRQSEGAGREYLYEAIKEFDDRVYFLDKIIAKFNYKKNDGLFDQLSELLFEFALNKNDAAIKTLKKMYGDILNFLLNKKYFRRDAYNIQGEHFERVCVLLIEMDGYPDFLSILSDLKALTDKHTKTFDGYFDWFCFKACELFGEKKALKAINGAGIKYEPLVKPKIKPDKTESAETKPDLNVLIAACKDKNSNEYRTLSRYMRRGELSADEVKRVAQAVLDDGKKENDRFAAFA